MVEGDKLIKDIIKYSVDLIEYVVITDQKPHIGFDEPVDIYTTDLDSLKEISNMIHPQGILAVCKIPEPYFSQQWDSAGFALYFDGIQDPGNLGTMLRAAEWYGIDQVLIGPETVDPYSPKVVQAAMGSHSYLHIFQFDHNRVADLSCPILVADMKGQDAFGFEWPDRGILVLGNEGQGISPFFHELDSTIILTLPPSGSAHTESLNVSMACTAFLTLRHLYFHESDR